MKGRERLEQLQRKMREQAGVRRGRGRPRLPIDPLRVMELALLGLNNKEIAASLPCDPKTLRRFAGELAQARARRQALSKLQDFQAALQGDVDAQCRILAHADRTKGRPKLNPRRRQGAKGSRMEDK